MPNRKKKLQSKNNFTEQIFLIMTGFGCNNNCVMCTTQPKHQYYSDRNTNDIIKDLKNGQKLHYSRVEFTGGEPTIRKDIVFLIKCARDLGYQEIGVSTNGRMFSYRKFTSELIAAGLNKVNISLYGHNSKLHDAITRVENSFLQTTKGIQLLLQYSNVVLGVNTVVFNLNYKYLDKIAKYLLSIKVKSWNPLDLIPDGYAQTFYPQLSVPNLAALSQQFDKLVPIIPRFEKVIFFDFPLCVFSPKIQRLSNIEFISAQGRIKSIKQIGYNPKRFELQKNEQIYNDIHKTRISVCSRCKFYNICGGIWTKYLELHKNNILEIEQLARKNHLLIK